MTQPPDWAIKVPGVDVTQVPGGADTPQLPDTEALRKMCALLLGQYPLIASLINLGSADSSSSGVLGAALTGTQTFADLMCEFITGVSSTGTTADTIIGGATDWLGLGNDLLGGSATNIADLFDWTDGWLTDLLDFLGDPLGLGSGSIFGSIPNFNVAGVFGPSGIGGAMQYVVDSLFSSLTGASSSSIPLPWLANSLTDLVGKVNYLVGESVTNPPVIEYFDASGTYNIPAWSNFLDVLVLGGGGGGSACSVLAWGDGGDAGSWNTAILERGVDIPGGTTTLTITVGAGGAGGSLSSGSNGSSSSASGSGWSGISGAGGAGATTTTAQITGEGAGEQTVNDITYYGGADQTVAFEDGNSPGGGGAGATILFLTAGDGADGGVWVRAYE